jgi:hypothetical protein
MLGGFADRNLDEYMRNTTKLLMYKKKKLQ